jgi:hypothetical protein
MKLNHGLHLAYCTNVHRGETWAETFDALERYTLAVKQRVCPKDTYAIGLRLGHTAAVELSDRTTLRKFQNWLDQHQCYVFTINGFPYGKFHGTRVKEQVYQPDWSSPERLAYTNLLFELLADLLPAGLEGSVSTVPCGFKALVKTPDHLDQIRANLWSAVEFVARLSEKSGHDLHLGLEPEPGCVLETSEETTRFFESLRQEHPRDPRLNRHLGVNYDTCHFAVEFEEPKLALDSLKQNEIRLSKLHLSSALKVKDYVENRRALAGFVDEVYFHQTFVQSENGNKNYYPDLDQALATHPPIPPGGQPSEWRIHFHVPLHSAPGNAFGNTTDHLSGALDWLAVNPGACSHLEMETYTWEVLPENLKSRSVVDQLVGEYDWTLKQLAERGLYSQART